MSAVESDRPEIVGMPWDDFIDGGHDDAGRWVDAEAEWAGFRTMWEPGQHLALCGPTGSGKTNTAHGLLQLRRFVLALDAKGGDTTLKKLRWPRLDKWPPPRKFWRDIEEGNAGRYIVGPVAQRKEDFATIRRVLAACLDDVFAAGGFTVYCDELRLMTDSSMMGLRGSIEQFLIAARDKSISVVSAFQSPAWVPRTAGDQTTWFLTWYTRDTDVVARLGEMAGRPRHEMRGIVKGLGAMRFSLVCISRDPFAPIIVTKPPKVS